MDYKGFYHDFIVAQKKKKVARSVKQQVAQVSSQNERHKQLYNSVQGHTAISSKIRMTHLLWIKSFIYLFWFQPQIKPT